VVVVAVLLTLGTWVGEDDHFPFGPFRMYATATTPTGAVSVLAIEVRMPGGPWRPADLEPHSVGISRAELEGQFRRVVAEPERLGMLADAHARLHPDERRWEAVRLLRVGRRLVDGRPTGSEQRTVLAQWAR